MRILVIEDEPQMREAIEVGLRQRGFAVDGAGTGAEGEALVARGEGRYDLIVLDLMLPDIGGNEVCRKLRRRGVGTPILMLTALGTTEDKVAGLDAGADDYVTKPFQFVELVSRIRAILRRGQPTESRTLTVADLSLDLAKRCGKRGTRSFKLTNKEFMLLEVLMRNHDRILSRQQIGEKVWDMNFDPSSNVVDVYVLMLRKHVDRGFKRKLIQTVKGAGYVLSDKEYDVD